MALGHSPRIVTDGLVLCLDAANVKSYSGSGTTWTDISNNGNNGTLSNITYAGSPSYMEFVSGSSSGISLGNKFNYTSESFTFSYWIYLNSYTTSVANQGPIPFYKGAYQVNGFYHSIQSANPGLITFATNQSGAVQSTFTATGAVPLTTWKNICITRSGTSAKIYVNGIDSTASAGTHTNPTSSSDNFVIGYYGSGVGSIYGNFRMSAFVGYNRALSAAEVLQNFNALRGRFGV